MENDLTLYKETSVGVTVKHKQLAFTIQIPEIRSGIDHMITQYGTLYYGTLLPKIFTDTHSLPGPVYENKDGWIKRLSDIENYISTNEISVQRISFLLELCRELLKTQWKWPSLLNRMPDGSLKFNRGGARAVASMLTTSDPWNHLPVLFYDKDGFDVNDVLKDYIVVDSLDKLHNIFQSGDDEKSDPIVNLTLSYKKINNVFWPVLDSIAGCLADPRKGIDLNDKDEFGLKRSEQFIGNYRAWREKYPSRPTLHIYTNWPESVIDKNQVWNIVHAGPSTPIIEMLQGFGNRPAVLEKPCQEIHSDPLYTIGHTLYILDDRKLDVGYFLPWMDLEHTTFIDENWKFIMYRKDQVYKNTFVKIGRPQ
jgi:hypothetical protein